MHFSPGAACRGNFVPYSEKRDRVFYLIFTSPDAFFKFSTKSGHVRRRPKLTFEKLNINSVFPFFSGQSVSLLTAPWESPYMDRPGRPHPHLAHIYTRTCVFFQTSNFMGCGCALLFVTLSHFHIGGGRNRDF